MVKTAHSENRVKPGYKQTEVGVIPEEWEVCNLSCISSKITDGDHATPQRCKHGYYLLSARNILNGSIDVSDVDYVDDDEYKRMRQRCGPDAGDILISCSGTIGRVCVVPVGFRCVLVRSAALVKVDKRLADGRFIQFWLQSNQAQGQIGRSVNQGAQPNLFLNHIERLQCPQPSLAEQCAIAEALTDADAYVASLQKLIAKKRDLKQAAMQQLLSGRKRLAGFKGAWQKKLFEELFTFSGGYSASRAQLSSEGHRYLHYGDIHTSNKVLVDVDADHGDLPRLPVQISKVAPDSLLCDGDVVFVDASEDAAGTSKHVVVKNEANLPFISGLHTIVAKRKTGGLRREYLCHCFQTHDIRRQFLFYAVGTKVSGVSKGNIGRIDLPVPCPAEQAAIAEVLSDMDSEIEALEDKLAKVRQIKQGMMQELLTGKTRLI